MAEQRAGDLQPVSGLTSACKHISGNGNFIPVTLRYVFSLQISLRRLLHRHEKVHRRAQLLPLATQGAEVSDRGHHIHCWGLAGWEGLWSRKLISINYLLFAIYTFLQAVSSTLPFLSSWRRTGSMSLWLWTACSLCSLSSLPLWGLWSFSPRLALTVHLETPSLGPRRMCFFCSAATSSNFPEVLYLRRRNIDEMSNINMCNWKTSQYRSINGNDFKEESNKWLIWCIGGVYSPSYRWWTKGLGYISFCLTKSTNIVVSFSLIYWMHSFDKISIS